MTTASQGSLRSAPIAVMRPFSIRMAPFAMSGPFIVTMRPALMASLPSARAGAANGRATAAEARRRARGDWRLMMRGVRGESVECSGGWMGALLRFAGALRGPRVEHESAVDEHADDARGEFERLAGPQHEVRVLADSDRADAGIDADHARRRDRDRGE